jgi:hypothetical protein
MMANGPDIQYTLNIKENRPKFFTWALDETNQDRSSTNHFKENSGSWRLVPVEKEGRLKTEVTYTSLVVLKPPIPRWVSKNLQLKAVPQLLREFTEESERRRKISDSEEEKKKAIVG